MTGIDKIGGGWLARWKESGLVQPAWLLAAAAVLALFGTDLAWSAAFLVLAIVFRIEIKSAFNALSAAVLSSTGIEIALRGLSIKLTMPQARALIQEMADELATLTVDQKKLFVFIVQHRLELNRDLSELLKFIRKKPPTVLHCDLRELRERQLIRPRERGAWRPEKHLEITRFGEIAAKSETFQNITMDDQELEAYLVRAQSEAQ